ncbi:CG14071 [Drosophila busckii]|uniref:CG14071 n=1 Tax=Drosophila busckii TaxID=30019 RepID=A0A0M4E4D2_DROBS|nr:uncharacterized protein LOC108603720 [Drosophila busckii]ALC38696.1 CG14071 [Drosophila busckii]
MASMPKVFVRQINAGVVLSRELSMKIFSYDAMSQEFSQLDNEICKIRKQQDDMENSLAEALAEDEYERCLNSSSQQLPQQYVPSEEEFYEIFKQHLSRIIEKLTAKYERKIYLELDMRKLKLCIEKGIVAANEETAAAEAAANN